MSVVTKTKTNKTAEAKISDTLFFSNISPFTFFSRGTMIHSIERDSSSVLGRSATCQSQCDQRVGLKSGPKNCTCSAIVYQTPNEACVCVMVSYTALYCLER